MVVEAADLRLSFRPESLQRAWVLLVPRAAGGLSAILPSGYVDYPANGFWEYGA